MSSPSSPTMTQASSLPEPLPETRPTPQTPDADRLIIVYLRTLTSPQTIKTHNTEIRMFVSYLEDKIGKGLEELTAEDLSLYREHLIKTYAAATAAKKLAVLRRFLIFTYMAGATAVNPEALRFFAKSPKVHLDPSYNVLTEDELSRMLSAARTSNYRDYVLLAVMAGCGLREAEVVEIRIGDFQEVREGEILLRVRGKGDKIRNVPHSIRHTVGTNMAINEAPLLVIQQFLGHSDPKTTLRYIRRAEELATQAYQYNTLPM